MTDIGSYKNVGFHRNQCKRQIIYGNEDQKSLFFKQNFMYYSDLLHFVLFHAIVAFQKYHQYCAESKGQTNIQEN